MAKRLETMSYMNAALVGADLFARQGIAGLLKSVDPTINVVSSTDNFQELHALLDQQRIDILFMSGAERNNHTVECIKNIAYIRNRFPELIVCMYSTHANSWLWVRGDIDAYISLQNPIYYWRTSLLKLVDSRYQPKNKPAALSLTPGELRVLKELKNGLDIRYIAEMEKLSYRRVSALKSSAIRKLGLRNKTDLLVFLTS